MKKTPLDRARIDHITKYVTEHRERIHERLRELLADDDGDPLPCIIMLPTGDGCAVLSNMPTETTMGVIRAASMSLEREAFAKAFARAIGEGFATVLDEVVLAPSEPVTDDGDKVH